MNFKYFFLLFLTVILTINLQAQENFFSYEKVRVDEINSIEKKYNSRVYRAQMDHMFGEKDGTLTDYGKPKIYYRQKNKVLDLIHVKYFYRENDSLVERISYTWTNPEKAKLKGFSKMFDKIVKKITTDLDLPIGEQGKLTKVIDDTVNGIPVEQTIRRVTWIHKEAKITVIMLWTATKGAYLATSIEWK